MNRNQIFNFSMLAALIFGGILGGLDLPQFHGFSKGISHLFINLLKLLSLPMIFLAIVSTLSRMSSLQEAKSLLAKVLKYTLLTTLIASTIGLILFFLIQPVQESLSSGATYSGEQGSYLSFLMNIIPENPIAPFLENNVLAVAMIATVFSIAILSLPAKQGALLRDIFNALFDALLKITSWVIFLMPLGVFAFTVQFTLSLKQGGQGLRSLLLYGLCVIAANVIQGVVILPILLKMKGLSPLKTAKGMLPALTLAFFSKSSSAALPVSLECAQNRLGVSEKTSRFTFPLCSIINMNGCAAFILITVFFVSFSQGMTLSIWQALPWIVLSTIAAIGNAGVPMGCFFLTTAFLIGMGASIQMMGMILPLYSLFDMVETALNVWSDSCITATVDQDIKETTVTPIEAN